MLLTIAIVLIILWVGCLFARVIGGVVHLILIIAVVLFAFHFLKHGSLPDSLREIVPARFSR